MSGGPPHHPHSRQAPPTNTAWNHLQVPNFFPGRQLQHPHMSQPTWHTPTTEPMKTLTHSHIFGLEQMLGDRQYQRHGPSPGSGPGPGPGPGGVDLTLSRNGNTNQNGEILPQSTISTTTSPLATATTSTTTISSTLSSSLLTTTTTTPISLSVRDTNKINSLPPSALESDLNTTTLKPLSPVLKSISPGLINDNNLTTSKKRSSKRVDSILERLNPNLEKQQLQPQPQQQQETTTINSDINTTNVELCEKNTTITTTGSSRSGVIVQATGSHDENSNSSSILNVPTPTPRDDEVVSPYSNEDSLDSNKSRRKRKPSKTIRVTTTTTTKDDDKILPTTTTTITTSNSGNTQPPQQSEDTTTVKKLESAESIIDDNKKIEKSIDECDGPKRRKTSSESETIDNIAAMVQEGLKPKSEDVVDDNNKKEEEVGGVVVGTPSISISVIKSSETTTTDVSTTQKNQFVEVENKLEEMFAGIADDNEDDKKQAIINNSKTIENLEDVISPIIDVPTSQVTSTSNDNIPITKKSLKKTKKKTTATNKSRRNSDVETTPPKKKLSSTKNKQSVGTINKNKIGTISPSVIQKNKKSKLDNIKDIYAYDSGSNASSSKSRGPFIQIRGPRDSPLSVNVINTPINDDETGGGGRQQNRTSSKKYHDDSEYRHKVRSKGLHCSTLSNQYDAQTKDISWICAFCKRGPHATELSGPTLTQNCLAPGDLFGPYFITTNCPEFERRLDDPFDKQFKSKKVVKALNDTLDNTTTTIGKNCGGKKTKRKHSIDSSIGGGSGGNNRRISSGDDIYFGITDTGNGTYEIWAHEDCIVWSAGVYLIGPKIIGLEEAVWTSCNVMCDKCHLKGANICCLKRGCLHVAHLCCARLSNWQFDEENYKTYCPEHRVP